MRALLVTALLLPAGLAHGFVKEFTEVGKSKTQGLDQNDYNNFKSKNISQDKFYGGFRDLYRSFSEKTNVPGFISAAPQNEIGKVVGPDVMGTSFRVGDTVYIRWATGQTPQVGAIFSVYTPAIVMQNMADPTDFQVGLVPVNSSDPLPKDHRLAGYFYESSGKVRVTKVDQGIVQAILETQTGQIQIGDHLMVPPPSNLVIKPTYGSIQLSAAVVCGSPSDRISTTKNSYIYINRGSRDGIRVGQMFEAVERVGLDPSVSAANPEVSAGEAMVIHTTDAFSTAVITSQFDVIRMGSLLRTKNPNAPVLSKAPFTNMRQNVSTKAPVEKPDELPEVPSLDDPLNNAPNLPDPMLQKPEPKLSPLSELDALEKSMNPQNLSPEEKNRLSRLSRQQRVGESAPKAEEDDEESNPDLPGLESSFSKNKKAAKKPAKKKKQSNDEEELNMLMMQN